jgi:hypothetical protein
MYQPYPGGSQAPEPSRPVAAPTTVARAVQVMYVGAAASLIGIVITVLDRHAIRTAIINHNHKLTASQVTSDYHAALGIAIVGGLIGVGLWIWMAMMCRAGRSWARIVSTVFFGIETIDLAIGSAVPGGGSGVSRIYGILVWLIGLIAVIFLWQRPSTEYFKGEQQY